jgi:hypothetical protein
LTLPSFVSGGTAVSDDDYDKNTSIPYLFMCLLDSPNANSPYTALID